MGQDEHATVSVLRMLDSQGTKGLWPKESSVDQTIYEIHQRLCVLQSLWLENGVWVEDLVLQVDLKRALVRAIE